MPASITIRPAQKRDRGQIILPCIELFGANTDPINRPLVENYPEIITRSWEKVKIRKAHILVAEQGATIVGYIKWSIYEGVPMYTYKKGAFVEELVVHQPIQRQGIGRALLAAFEKIVSPVADRVMLSSDAQTTTKLFYEKVGYHASAYRMLKVLR